MHKGMTKNFTRFVSWAPRYPPTLNQLLPNQARAAASQVLLALDRTRTLALKRSSLSVC
ncbi:hypothetical protein BQ8794_290112 [Mesorhizobium prunaredense]|uniref:Uncharacterized protein n=1 Tax=Mesorhizobium prunaredense TaxID=1631249 RepID=A0A1R3V9A4_9HYPH|nr:hypothetical protein BQ8794_290112 [Mesorhizobium prunaredense]